MPTEGERQAALPPPWGARGGGGVPAPRSKFVLKPRGTIFLRGTIHFNYLAGRVNLYG